MFIRPMLFDDIEVIAALNRQLQPPLWSKEQLTDSFSIEHRFNRILCIDDIVQGYYVAQPLTDELELLQMAVAPGFQRQGFGNSLMADLLDQAKIRQVNAIQLDVRASNEAAKALYQQWGFLVVGRRKNYYPPLSPHSPKDDALLMTRRLHIST